MYYIIWLDCWNIVLFCIKKLYFYIHIYKNAVTHVHSYTFIKINVCISN